VASAQYFYELSEAADDDLQEIYDYTAAKFGIDQAIKYLSGLDDLFYVLCTHPHTGRMRNEIRKGIRSSSYVSHIVFYRVVDKHIRIVRVLHASRDIPKFL
jgi:toxin ParE1/3/4